MRKQKMPAISDAEWSVMKVLWEKSPRTSREVVDELASGTDWSPKTVHTLLMRLVKKRALSTTRNGREYLFKPTVRAEECQRHESQSFLERVFDGEMAPFLACFVKGKKLSRAEIDKLKRILDGKK